MAVIKDILITEKSIAQARMGQYTFLVDESASKQSVMQAVATQFNVHPISCNISVLPRKEIKRGKATGLRGLRKKAYIKLKKGETIAAFDFPIEEEEKKETKKDIKPIKKEDQKLAEKTKVVKREQGRVKV